MSGGARQPERGAGPYRSYDIGGRDVLVGRGDRQNDELTFHVARPHDLWLHAAGFAGSHVIIRTGEGEEVPREVLEKAAQLAAFHSKARAAGGKVAVHVCHVADVSKPPGSPAGQVQLRRFETIRVYVNRREWEGEGGMERGQGSGSGNAGTGDG